IWDESALFLKLRDFANYKGKCGVCEYRRWCGGCRARAYGLTGDYMAAEPSCSFEPKGWQKLKAKQASNSQEG
ncbi:MAG: radical SAM/SPASM domain-containing protein, partial [Candidatus Hydrogenedentes bacterium]|nr:radical SAM/SPASM domain-containing protein [Candidatus Hydrogenedentota bacterium]